MPFPHKLTTEEAARGGRARQVQLRERRQAVEEEVIEKLAEQALAAAQAYVDGLDAKRPSDRLAAADRILERVLGKVAQRLEGGDQPVRIIVQSIAPAESEDAGQ